MSIQLILIRHGIAEDLSQGVCDFDRGLTSDGIRLLEKTIWRLRPFQTPSEETVILTSPRKRAVETAGIVSRVFHTEDIRQKVFVDEGCFSELVNFLDELPEELEQTVFVVGHQPTLGYWSNILCDRNLPFKKGAAASFTIQGHSIKSAKLDWFFQPEDMLSLQDRGSSDERTENYAIVISRLMKSLLASIKAFDNGETDIETIHQIRVLSRKATAALLLYRSILRKSVFSNAKRTLKQVTKTFSALRDVDVLTEAFLQYLSGGPARTKIDKEIYRRLSELRLKEEASAREKLSSGRLVRRIESESSKKTIMDTFFASNSRGTMPFDPVAKLDKQRLKLVLISGELDPEDDKGVHAFRVEARQLRYMMELAGDQKVRSLIIRGMSPENIQQDFGRLCEARRGIRILASLQIPAGGGRTSGKELFADYLRRMEAEALSDLRKCFFSKQN